MIPLREAEAGRSVGSAETGGRSLEEEIVRDLRHTVGNHFHKLFYWADRLAHESDEACRLDNLSEINNSLQRLQEHIEVGLGLLEPVEANMSAMRVDEVASATRGVFASLLAEVPFEVTVEPGAEGRQAWIDPQQFSHSLRTLIPLLGGPRRAGFSCHFSSLPSESSLDVRLEAHGGQAPLEVPVLEWAVARQAIVSQGGTLGRSSDQEEIGGCTITLPITSKSQER